jgi:hypothetical protein
MLKTNRNIQGVSLSHCIDDPDLNYVRRLHITTHRHKKRILFDRDFAGIFST